MRIGIDGRELGGRATGVGRYLRGLLREWGRADQSRNEFVLYSPEPIEGTLDARRFATRIVAGSGGTWWEQMSLPRAMARDGLDVLFAPAYTAPLFVRTPTVVTIHDVSFMAHPEWFGVREGIRRRTLTRSSARRARAVVTVSEFSRRELTEWLDVPGARIHVIPQGLGVVAPATHRLDTPPRLLYVGSVFNRRHVDDLVRAFEPLARARPDVSLDIVGDNRTFPHVDLAALVNSFELVGRIRWHRYVADEQLAQLYTEARAFAFLSEYEGLGMTPLEALAAGVPPVLADTPVARESCGDAALYVRLGDLGATTRALELALFDHSTRGRILAAAPGVLSKYSWTRAARETMAVLEASGR
jgi:glycosyltransferase involved in cell wall biosynthesis